jgi:hypothetical protein
MSKKNSVQQVDVCIYRGGVTSSPTSSWTFQHLKMDHYTVSKCWVPIILWCGVTSHKNKHFNYTTAKTKKLAFIIIFRRAHYKFLHARCASTSYHTYDPFYYYPPIYVWDCQSGLTSLATIRYIFLTFIMHTACSLIILLMLGKRQTLWSSKQEPFSKACTNITEKL